MRSFFSTSKRKSFLTPARALVAAASCLLATSAWSDVLFDQMTNYSPTIIPSSWYAPDGLDGDTYAWDNFLLPYRSDIKEVWWVGGGGTISGVTIRFYEGLPAAPDMQPKITSLPESEKPTDYYKGYRFNLASINETPVGGGLNMYHAVLPTPLRLPGRKVYWVKIEGDCTNGHSWGLASGTHGRDTAYFRFITGWLFHHLTGTLAFQLKGTAYSPLPIGPRSS